MVTLLPVRKTLEATRLSRTTLYDRIAKGLMTRPVKQGPRLSAWPSNEIEAINRATIAGASPDALRALVADLERQRTAIAA